MPSPSPFLLCIIFNVASLFVNLPHFTDGQQQQMLPMLANEPFPPSAAVAGGPPAAAPTEEQLISRLLKNPGLPPSGPPSMKNEAEKANAGNAIESGTTMGNNKAGENAVAAVAAGPGPSPPPSPIFSGQIPSIVAIRQQQLHSPPSPPPGYIQCLMQIQARVCDPNAILNEKERTEIDETLKELEMATRKETAPNVCERGGLQLMVILTKHSALHGEEMNSVQQKLNEALNVWVRDSAHKCEKPAILMLSADPDMMNRRVWTGRHWAVPVETGEMVKLYFAQEHLTKQEKYADVILNVVEGMLDRYEQHAFGTATAAMQ